MKQASRGCAIMYPSCEDPGSHPQGVRPAAASGGDVVLGHVLSMCVFPPQVAFDELESNLRKTAERQRDFWSKTKRLQHGTLVCLLLPPESGQVGGGGGEGAGQLRACEAELQWHASTPLSPTPRIKEFTPPAVIEGGG